MTRAQRKIAIDHLLDGARGRRNALRQLGAYQAEQMTIDLPEKRKAKR